MSTAYSSAKQKYIGNGVTTEWGFDFPIQKHSELKVYLKRSVQPQVLLEEGVDYSFVTENTIAFPIKTGEAKLQATDVLALQRESVFESEYNFSNQQRLEPEEVMHADDNLERQIQELKRDSESAIKVQPTSNINTDEYFIAVESIYENLDNITTVSGISSDIITCSDNISDISTVSSNIDNVNAVGQSISSVNTVAGNVSSVNTVAGVSTDVTTVASIASSVATVANNDANITTVATNISDVNTAATNIAAIQDAYNNANTAQTMATQAGQSASEAAQSAQTATDKADEASESARLAVSALSLQIGDVCFAPLGIDESLNLRRYLNGQVLIQSQFVSFTSKVKSAIALYPNLATTETNWQAEKTNSKLGQCGKFVVDDTAGTIRLPCVVNAQSLADLALIGGIKSESLPNITGSFDINTVHNPTGNGALYAKPTTTSNNATSQGYNTNNQLGFDASRSSSTYQDNAPVQQEAVQYPYCIVVNTGAEEAERPINNYQVNNVYSYGMSQYYKGTMNNNSWLKSAGQWNDGTVYTGMYNWLLEQMNAGVSGFVASTAAYTDYDFVINTANQTFRLPLLNGERVLVAKKEPTAEDLTWYNLYSDGWLEQGICKLTINTGENVISFQKAFKDTFYNYTETTLTGSGDYAVRNTVPVLHKKTTTSITVQSTPNFTNAFGFVVKGYAPIPTQSDYTEINGLYYYVGDTLQNAQLINVARIEETVVNKTNKVQAAAASMPSNRYIDLTLGASGSTYTAPANGIFTLNKLCSSGDYIALYTPKNGLNSYYKASSNEYVKVSLPVKNGSIVKCDYTSSGETRYLRFIYAEGEN